MKRRVMLAIACVLGFGVLGLGLLAGSAAAQITSHRAAYSLSLGAARAGSGVIGVTGAMLLDWQQSCEGWTLHQRMRFQLADGEGGSVDSDLNFSSWEARDGLSYRFTMRSLRNGELEEELRGRADLDAKDRSGKASFQLPAGQVMELPPGTLFPTEHTVLLLDRARNGETLLSRPVFDGSTLDGSLDINAIIGPQQPGQPSDNPQLDAAAARPGWRVRMAFFKPGSEAPVPEYEVGMMLLDNGIARDFLFEYGDFSIRAKLERLEALPKPEC